MALALLPLLETLTICAATAENRVPFPDAQILRLLHLVPNLIQCSPWLILVPNVMWLAIEIPPSELLADLFAVLAGPSLLPNFTSLTITWASISESAWKEVLRVVSRPDDPPSMSSLVSVNFTGCLTHTHIIEPQTVLRIREGYLEHNPTSHDQVSRIQEEDVANHASIHRCERNPLRVAQIGASGSRTGDWSCVPRTQEEEPNSGVLQTGVPTGSKTKGCPRGTQANQTLYNPAWELARSSTARSRSQGKGQRVGVLVLSSERGAKARPEQQDGDKSTPGSSPRTKQSQTPRGHQGVMSVKEPTGGARGTPVTIQERSRLGMDIRSEYPPT
ncbi:hypothetical protein DFH08DRAFT_826983 [Mycena albidolilacea]|uniref:Uncharacterized protein n=1 Tax=Mycena albidolilacea TaxID=1033008 RepID=A0AAD6YZD9_9AGAR|nr:hypothetical protein DFH08DRAFT_826983 [Mycena albidolilacea]